MELESRESHGIARLSSFNPFLDVGSGIVSPIPLFSIDVLDKALNSSTPPKVINVSMGWDPDNNVCNPAWKDGVPADKAAALVKQESGAAAFWRRAIGAFKDTLWVVAAGNECRDAKYSAVPQLSQGLANLITVGSIDKSGKISSFSNFGPDVSVLAPGGDILSTWPTGCVLSICHENYHNLSGTSMAAPFVTGVAALLMSANSDITPAQAKTCIVDGAAAGAHKPVAGPDGHPIPVLDAGEALQCGIPAAPTNLQATAVDQHSIKLTWLDKSDNEDVFNIYGSAGTFIDKVGANVKTYTVTGLDPNTNHCYVVSAFNSAGESAKSGQACATTQAAVQPPAAPSNAQVAWANAAEAWTLTWQDNSGNETGFQIMGAYYNQDAVSIAQVGANVTSFFLVGDQAVYDCYEVSAFNAAGYSGWSNWACKTSAPAAPSNAQVAWANAAEAWTFNVARQLRKRDRIPDYGRLLQPRRGKHRPSRGKCHLVFPFRRPGRL